MGSRPVAAAVLREEGTLWNHVESSKQRKDVPWLCRALFIARVSESHVRPASSSCLGTWHRPASCREGSCRNRPPTFVRNVRSDRSSFPASATSAALGRVVAGRSSSRRLGRRANLCLRRGSVDEKRAQSPVDCRWVGLEGSSVRRQFELGQVFSGVARRLGRVVALPGHRRDRGRTQLFPTLIQGIPDVVHRRVLLAQGDDLLTKSLPGRRQLGLLRLWQKELSLRVFAELMAQDAKTPGCVAEPLGRLC